MAVRGFRTKIALNVVILLLISALITDILVIVIIQGVMVRDLLDRQSHQISWFGRAVLQRPQANQATQMEKQLLTAFTLVEGDLRSDMLVADQYGTVLYEKSGDRHTVEQLRNGVKTAAQTGRTHRKYFDITWAVYWWNPSAVLVSVPIYIDGRFRGSVATIVPLVPLYDKLRKYNRPVFLYILFNTIVLASIGLYRIFRIYLRPIDRLVHQADDYGQNEDFFFTFRQGESDLNRLSSALNRMLKRIADDKSKLTETVNHLEKANEELRRAQNEIIRAEKMASVGRLAAGIAHEIGNPIGIVLGYLDLLKQSDLDREEHDEYTRRAESEIQRINRVIRQLLDLARPKQSVNDYTSVHDVINDIVEVMAHQPMMSGIILEKRFEARLDCIRGDTDQLRQVFLNLLLNAADAIKSYENIDQGSILISTSLSQEAKAQEKKWLCIEFQDNGEGINEEQLGNIFDPFYTTKEPGKGTGLGLAVSFIIIEKMGGTISVKSTIGQGTTMSIRLPIDSTVTALNDPIRNENHQPFAKSDAND